MSGYRHRFFALPAAVLLCVSLVRAEIYYPWNDVAIGAFDAPVWTGLVFAPAKDTAFAFRIRIQRDYDQADGTDFHYLVSEVGPHSPGGQYVRLRVDLGLPYHRGDETPILVKPSPRSDTLVFEWSRQDERTVIGRIICPKKVEVHLIHYVPWGLKGGYTIGSEGEIRGETADPKRQYYYLWTDRRGEPLSSSETGEAIVAYSMGRGRDLYFAAGVGDDPRILQNHLYRYKNARTIDDMLEEEASRYAQNRTLLEGPYRGAPESVVNTVFWNILFDPNGRRFYTPATRLRRAPRAEGGTEIWTMFPLESLFHALLASVESERLATDIALSALETQSPNGGLPHWRAASGAGTPDRSQPPLGAYLALKLFEKVGDMDFLRAAYPFLQKWHAFWKLRRTNGSLNRDGNNDGLFEWGANLELLPRKLSPWEESIDPKARAGIESGQPDSPLWDNALFNGETGTLALNCVDLSSLYALDAWCLSQMANVLNLKPDYEDYLAEYERVKDLVNAQLWNEREGFYFDRYWDGRFSTRKAASSFYPLLARIPDPKRALRMLKHLLNPREFWGETVIPTISRDDIAFKDQGAWRGTLQPVANYLVYQGLKVYGFDAAASEFADRSALLFLRSWENFQLSPEFFDARSGDAEGDRFAVRGPLFALLALEEYLDFTPWDGFRFGVLSPARKGRLSRVSIQGRRYDVSVSSSETLLRDEGRDIVEADGGAVFRHFLYSEEEVSFEIKSLAPRDISIELLKKGKYQLSIDGVEKEIFKGKTADFEVPAGDHAVLVLLLEAEE
jgi:hypothetical protein